jgi:hypothetical protein
MEILFALRSGVYQVSLSLEGPKLISRMPRSLNLPEFPVSIDLFCRSGLLAFLMASLWECTNVFFDAFIAKVYSGPGKSYRVTRCRLLRAKYSVLSLTTLTEL